MNSGDTDYQSYQIPFAKVSQTAKRKDNSSNRYHRNNKCTDNSKDDYIENIFKSQDLFMSLEDDNTNSYTREPSTQQDYILQTKLGMKCGLTVVRSRNEHDTLTSRGNWNYHEELPHPKKLLQRKKGMKLLPLTERRKNQKDDEGQGVKQHLKQLMVKQSRRKSDNQLIIKFPFSNKNKENFTTYEKTDHFSNTNVCSECPTDMSHKSQTKSDKKIILHQETVTVSTWDEVETWIHKRWKTASIPVKPIEE